MMAKKVDASTGEPPFLPWHDTALDQEHIRFSYGAVDMEHLYEYIDVSKRSGDSRPLQEEGVLELKRADPLIEHHFSLFTVVQSRRDSWLIFARPGHQASFIDEDDELHATQSTSSRSTTISRKRPVLWLRTIS
jgi:hypothetical protein